MAITYLFQIERKLANIDAVRYTFLSREAITVCIGRQVFLYSIFLLNYRTSCSCGTHHCEVVTIPINPDEIDNSVYVTVISKA